MPDDEPSSDEEEIPTPPAISAEDVLDELLSSIMRGEHNLDEDHEDFDVGRAVVNAEMLGVSFFGPEGDDAGEPVEPGEEELAAVTDAPATDEPPPAI